MQFARITLLFNENPLQYFPQGCEFKRLLKLRIGNALQKSLRSVGGRTPTHEHNAPSESRVLTQQYLVELYSGHHGRALKAGMNDIVTKPFDPQVLIRKVRYFVEQTRNEPIPIAILDRKRALRPADGRLIPSIDAGVVQQMFGEDLPLFKSALSRMLRDYVEFALPICASLDDQGARSQLKARVHELRGSAGLIGATRIMRLAGSAETALEQGRSIDIVEPILGQLTLAFSEMRDEAQIWLTRQAEREALSDAKATPRANIGIADVDELYALLDSRNLAALDKFSVLSPSLNELLGVARFDRLRDAMDNLDFPLGAQLLRESRCPIPA